MSLYIKHRPSNLEQLQGNKNIVDSLTKLLNDTEQTPHAFLFHGPTGCGKTTLARIVADKLDSSGDDLKELDTADFRGIDTVREIRKQSQYLPINSKRRVWILDECHKLTGDAQNALLKILEDPPEHVYFILCTTEFNKVIPTVKGRCVQFQVELLNDNQMMRLLRSVSKSENSPLTKSIYEQIILNSLGHPRNALQILDVVLHTDPDQRLEAANQAAEQQNESIELCRALIKGASWTEIRKILDGLKQQDPEGVRRVLLGYSKSVLLRGENNRAAHIIEELYEPLYNIGFPGLVFACYSIIKG